jgi:hypothetical protein
MTVTTGGGNAILIVDTFSTFYLAARLLTRSRGLSRFPRIFRGF